MDAKGLIVVFAGIFTIAAASSDWEWYWNSRKAAAMVGIIGKPASRILYGVLGLALTIGGFVFTFGLH